MAVYILSGARTSLGSLLGNLSDVHVSELGATAIKGAVKRANIEVSEINEVYMGHVVQAGCGQAPARQASLKAGISENVPCNTINKVCGSGLKTIIMGAQSIISGDNSCVVSGGMENMSMAPHFIPQSRRGIKFGDGSLKDSMLNDGLWDVYSNRAMGNCAEECATKYNFSRESQDQFAIESYKRAQEAIKAGLFKNEIEGVVVRDRKGERTIDEDEGPFAADFTKIPGLRPAFEKTGTITAANASTINDGAAAVILGSDDFKDKAKFKILSWSSHAHNPTWFTTAPVESINKCLQKANLKISDIDYFEINEAFSVVPMAAMKELNINHQKVNVYGGAVALGHPIGCSGTRIVVTLMNILEAKKGKYGLASICIGGGEALSLIIERL